MPDIDVTGYKKFTYRGGSFFTDASIKISKSAGLTYDPTDHRGFVHWLAGEKNMSVQEIVQLIEQKPPKELVDEYKNTSRKLYFKEPGRGSFFLTHPVAVHTITPLFVYDGIVGNTTTPK